jgi:hypothetical protein
MFFLSCSRISIWSCSILITITNLGEHCHFSICRSSFVTSSCRSWNICTSLANQSQSAVGGYEWYLRDLKQVVSKTGKLGKHYVVHVKFRGMLTLFKDWERMESVMTMSCICSSLRLQLVTNCSANEKIHAVKKSKIDDALVHICYRHGGWIAKRGIIWET